jgi:hypothetical protein
VFLGGRVMITRGLAQRLKRLETRLNPTIFPLPHFHIQYISPNGEIASEEWLPPDCQTTEEEKSWAAGRKRTQIAFERGQARQISAGERR